jgi:hypothetical protein
MLFKVMRRTWEETQAGRRLPPKIETVGQASSFEEAWEAAGTLAAAHGLHGSVERTYWWGRDRENGPLFTFTVQGSQG